MLVQITITIIAYFGMEFMAWFTHKYIMHGIMWFWHNDHHHKSSDSWFERNDIFFAIYAMPGSALIILGLLNNLDFCFFIGLGITLYGITYFLVHDIFIHQRIKIFRDTSNTYLLALRKAHKAHHKIIHKHDGTCFGMLFVPKKYYLEAKNILKRNL